MGRGVLGMGWGLAAIEVEGYQHGICGAISMDLVWWLGPHGVHGSIVLVALVGWGIVLDGQHGYHVSGVGYD